MKSGPTWGLQSRLPPDVYDRLVGWHTRVKPLVPWGSLTLGVSGLLLMERTPDRAWLVAAAAIIALALAVGFVALSRVETEDLSENHTWLLRCAHMGALLGTQSLLQVSLFFALPYYLKASSLLLGHLVFDALLLATAAVILWDPAYFAAMRHTSTRAGVQAVVSLATLNVILPIVGLSNRASLLAAAAITMAGLPLLDPHPRWRVVGVRTLVSVALGTLMLFGLGSFVPPAPLQLVRAAMGTQIRDHQLTDPQSTLTGRPRQLVCFTAIAAPRGLKDRIVHVWSHDEQQVDAIEVKIRGGRTQGFRTWSAKKNLGPRASGTWTCRVQTRSGQQLGRTQLVIR